MPLETKHKVIIIGGITLLLAGLSYAFRKQVISFVLDKIQEYHLAQLHPSVQDKFRNLIGQIEKNGYKVIITSSYRSFSKQIGLYKEDNRNAPPGLSHHNFGFALDLVIDKNGTRWTNEIEWRMNNGKNQKYLKNDWLSTGVPQLAKQLGFQWGGDIVGYNDPVHFNIGTYNTNYLKNLAVSQQGADLTKIQGNKVLIV